MPTNVERASLVSRHVQIESATLIDTRMKSTLHTIDQPATFRLGNWFRCRHELSPSDHDRLLVYVELKFEASPEGETDSGIAVVDLNATFLATYRLASASAFPEDALHHFADLNGTLNVWPYWRELVQSFAGRAGLPGVVVPVFRPRVKRIPEQKELEMPEQAAATNM
ncbi:MAG: hypothetical protein OXU69_09890 [Gemmatimonadota bacterium]|nr:hypothetical protein [Gemmatimonadota bacterium]MDE2985003.1 hypothetical protein [Gemmatimonadota bacterium]